MKRALAIGLLTVLSAALVTSDATASKPSRTYPGVLRVEDGGKFFTADGVKKAEDAFHGHTYHAQTKIHIVTYDKVPDNKRKDFLAAKDSAPDLNRFSGQWARELAAGTKGIFVLISREGRMIHAIDDRQSDVKRGFDETNLRQIEKDLNAAFASTKDKSPEERLKINDDGLMKVVTYVVDTIQDPEEPTKEGRNVGVSSIWGYVCIGLCVLLGVWLVIGLIRAFTGGGGGGYGPGGGYGGGYGGGGGGFFSSMMGGLFGAAAGMYLYNQFAGGSHMSDYSSGGEGGGYGDGGSADTGAGDYSGGGDGGGTSGGDWGDSGGDTGGGGGDWGDSGGGDTGGGGDWGDSGGGDMGGGGDW